MSTEHPRLKVMRSGEVFIETHNKRQVFFLANKCLKCPLRGTVCSGILEGGNAKLNAESPTGTEVLDFLNQASCKPTFNMNNLSILGGSYLIKQYYNSKARTSVGNK